MILTELEGNLKKQTWLYVFDQCPHFGPQEIYVGCGVIFEHHWMMFETMKRASG